MSFFYDLNKKLDSIRATPEVTHKQLNERDEGKPGKNFAKIAADAAERYGSKAAGERVAGAVRNKLGDQGKLEEEGFPRIQAAIRKYTQPGVNKLAQLGREGASKAKMDATRKKYNQYDESMEEGVMDTVKKVGKKVASGVNKLVGHGSDEEMRKDLQRKSGAPVTGKKPTAAPKQTPIDPKDEYDYFTGRDKVRGGEQQVKEKLSPAKQKSFAALAPPEHKITFADKIAGAKKEVDEMLGDVAAEAMRSALGGGRGRNAEMDEDNAFDYKKPRSMNKGERKPSSTGGEIHQKDDTTVVHTAGRNYGGGNEPDPAKEKQNRRGPPKKSDSPRQERVTSKSRKQDRTAHGQEGFKKAKGIGEGDVNITDQGEYDQEGDMAKDDIKTIVRHAQALEKILGDNDNLPEWVQSKLAKIEGMMISIDEYMQNQEGNDEEEPIAEKAVSKKQQKFMGMVHAAQKGEKPASKEVGKVAKTMKKKDAEDFASTKHKGLPEKAPKKKKEEEVEESSTTSGSVTTSTATTGSKGGVFGKGIYDSMNRELELMIAESMSINMSDSTEGNKSLTVTATDEDAMRLAVMLKSAGLGGQGRELQGDHMHSHDEEACDTCGMQDCGCGDVQEAVDENAPDWPTNTEQADSNFGYAGGLNKPKTDVAGDGQTTVPNTAVHTQDEDALRRMMEMAGLAEAAKPDFLDLDKDKNKDEPMKDAAADADEDEDTVKESIRRMMEIAGIQEAKKQVDQNGDGKNDFEDIKIARMKASGAIDDKEEKKVDESIFALTNQWRAYKG